MEAASNFRNTEGPTTSTPSSPQRDAKQGQDAASVPPGSAAFPGAAPLEGAPTGSAAAEGEALLRAIFETGPDALVLTDSRGRITLVNVKAEELFGGSRQEMIGESIEILVPERFRNRHVGDRATYAGHPRSRPLDSGLALFALRKDGTEIPVEISLSPIHAGAETFVVSAIRDVTLRKRTEEALRKSEEERLSSMSHMAAYVAHQLNTPLTNIALLTAAATKRSTDPKVLEGLRKIDEQRRTSAGIIRELMRFSSVSGTHRTPLDVRALVEQAMEQVRPSLRDTVTLAKEAPDTPVLIAADPVQMKEVFVNLLKNAAEATDHGQVTIRIANHGAQVRIVVEDTGFGMGPETLRSLFQPFFTTKAEGGGTGLGLAFARSVVTAYGGTITADSQLGKGSVFTFILPTPPREGGSEATAGDAHPGD